MTKINIKDKNSLLRASKLMLIESNLKMLVVTLSENGILFMNKKKYFIMSTIESDVFDVSGGVSNGADTSKIEFSIKSEFE